MFTGLIEATGTIASLTPGEGATRIIIAAPALANRWRTGDSIAVNGTCLTAIPVDDPHQFAADLAAETLERTTLGLLTVGTTVNLELPTPAGSPLGGHVVQGHVDATATLISIAPIHDDLATTDWRLTVELPPQLATQVISQGSITLDGISLTIAKLNGLRIEVAIIPHTYAATNLHTLKPGTRMNIETDVLAKYAAAQHRHAESDWLTEPYLIANGY
ncbi:riboflavin synthase [Granulicella sp. 5B5]|uniref:riboflavin synthase n=1 Tax=Granulicella sp. 5B5 TaxID=1617967 RepID=UPI0015F4D106|nr:riboflavin synthase [Granulicella sp. 5B5]QMV18263.1 riboflavin synthase [Granulicella sp. 5B5]